jgi:muramoyltetrapeptide carboxypeptidase LdcA involved in peptidoglycan recycling
VIIPNRFWKRDIIGVVSPSSMISEKMKLQLTKDVNFLKSLRLKAMLGNDASNIDDYYAETSEGRIRIRFCRMES